MTAAALLEVRVVWHGEVVKILRRRAPHGRRVTAHDLGVPELSEALDGRSLTTPTDAHATVRAILGATELELAFVEPTRVGGRPADALAWAAHGASFAMHALLLVLGVGLYATLDPNDAEIEADRATLLRDFDVTRDGTPLGDGSGDATRADVAAPTASEEPSAGAKSIGAGAALASPGRQSRASEREGADDAASFGMIGLLAARTPGEGGSAGPWAAAPGDGGFAGAEDLFGAALSGVGEGGGGSGTGVGIGRIGTRGHAARMDRKPRFGDHYATKFAVLCGIPLIERRDALGNVLPQPPCPGTMVNGRLPPETVQRVVRQNFGRFRACYESGLAKNPTLEGRVVVKFVIARDGSVAASQDDGSELGDASVVACIVRAMATISFPQPEGGIVTVAYPLVLSSG